MKLHSGNKYLVVGTMSGTSLDGLDLAAVEFTLIDNKWEFSMAAAETCPYPAEWEDRLKRHLPCRESNYWRCTMTMAGLPGK